MTREILGQGVEKGITSLTGLTAHGRGEAFDYLLGEKTTNTAEKSIRAAAAMLLLSKNPVISVNGNSAVLCAKDLVKLSNAIPAKLEVNIFHASKNRELKIKNHLTENGAKEVLMPNKNFKINFLESNRKFVNPQGIFKADVVLVPLEDGDRTEALVKNKRKVIAIDLNPLSRTAQKATITIVDNIIRAIPLLTKAIINYKKFNKDDLEKIIRDYKNKIGLNDSLKEINKNLKEKYI